MAINSLLGSSANLFGPSPAEVMLARQKEAQQEQLLRNQMITQQGQEFGPFRGLYQAGLRFGDIAGQAVRQGLFPAPVDPQLQEAVAVQSVLSKYSNQEQTDPAILTKIGQELMSVAPNAGLRALTIAQQLTKESPFGKIDPSKFTSASLQTFQRTKNVADLVPIEKAESPFAKIDPSKVTPDSLKVFQTTGKITDLVFKPDTDKGTEFERLIASLPPAEQAQARQNYLRKLTGQVMPPALVNLTMQEADAVGSLKTTINNVDRTLNDLTSGKLKLGVGKNFLNEFKTLAGKGGEESIAYNNFNATLTELQNKALLLNKGTQTEGDAVRALNEFMSNYAKYDTNTAIERLQRVAEKFKAAEASKRNAIVALGQRYNEDLSPFLPERGPAVRPQAISDDIIRREFNKPENSGWKSLGFEAFKKKFLELNK